MHQEYIDFLRFCIKENSPLPLSASKIDWREMLDFAQKQSIVGVMFHGIKQLTTACPHPNARELAQWGIESQRIAEENKEVYSDAFHIIDTIYRRWGHRSCLLKGQGNALMYPDKYMRSPGDIDLWVIPNDDEDIDDIVRLCRVITPGCVIEYHHSENPNLAKTPVELHYRPSFSENFLYNHRMQRYFISQREEQTQTIARLPDGLGKICMPTNEFNRIFQLSHIFKHFNSDGIGLRQIIDYYYLLRRGHSYEDRADFTLKSKSFGMYRFARGLMYVLHKYLGLESEYLLVSPSKHIGEFIWSEIMKTGNFGFSDERFTNMHSTKPVMNAIYSIIRGLRVVFMFPANMFLGHIPWIFWWHFYYRKKIWKVAEGRR